MGRVLYCTRCGHGIVVDRDVPAVCPNPQCHSSSWRCATHPSTPYALNFNDRAFLKSIRVLAEE